MLFSSLDGFTHSITLLIVLDVQLDLEESISLTLIKKKKKNQVYPLLPRAFLPHALFPFLQVLFFFDQLQPLTLLVVTLFAPSPPTLALRKLPRPTLLSLCLFIDVATIQHILTHIHTHLYLGPPSSFLSLLLSSLLSLFLSSPPLP